MLKDAQANIDLLIKSGSLVILTSIVTTQKFYWFDEVIKNFDIFWTVEHVLRWYEVNFVATRTHKHDPQLHCS